MHFLDFEKPIAELEGKIAELKHLSDGDGINIAEEIGRLQSRVEKDLSAAYAKLSPWQKTQVARHPERPHCVDYIDALIDEFMPMAGDRNYGEDHAIIGGLGRFKGQTVMVIGQEKGHDVESRLKHNFGMARPEGYRKAKRLMELADHYGLPVLTFVDTAGAYPGVGAEERGQAEAIARSIETSLNLRIPIISLVIGEGGSGGAIAIATANAVLMMEHAVYSVISPEGCASILWRDGAMAESAADALKLTAQDLQKLGVIDGIVPEPLGGAHRRPEAAFSAAAEAIQTQLKKLINEDGGRLRTARRNKFLAMGRVTGG